MSKEERFNTESIVKCVFAATFLVLNLIGNSMLIHSIIQVNKNLLKWPLYRFVLNLSVASLVPGILSIPFEIIDELLHEWLFGLVLCKLVEWIEHTALGAAIITHAFITMDRYEIVCRSPGRRKLDRNKTKYMIIFSWIVPALIFAPHLYLFQVVYIESIEVTACSPKDFDPKWIGKFICFIELAITVVVPFLTICYAQFKVIKTVWMKKKVQVGQLNGRRSLKKATIRVTKMTVAVVGLYILCWSPHFFMRMMYFFIGKIYHRHSTLYEAAMLAGYVNEALTPIIFLSLDTNIDNCLARGFGRSQEEENCDEEIVENESTRYA